MTKEIVLKPRVNKKNNQINFSLKKKSLPKKILPKLGNLKGIKFKVEDLLF